MSVSRLFTGAVVDSVFGVETLQSPTQPVGVGRKQLFHHHRPDDDPLLKSVLDYFL
jgi:hypothetical protein